MSFDIIKSDNNTYKTLLNGKWIQTNKNFIKIVSPIDGTEVGKIQSMTPSDVDKSIEGIKTSYKIWAEKSVTERAEVLHKAARLLLDNAEYLAKILSKEISKDFKSSLSEIKRTAEFIDYTAEEGKRLKGETLYGDSFDAKSKNKISIVNREPLGVILAIAPFNYPINLSASKIAPALMGGNGILFKPPTQGSISALHLAEIFRLAGLPDGVLNTVTGKGSEIGDYLITHKGIDMINFTGSTAVGQQIAKKSHMVPLIMELGGKDAAIVLEDANIDETADLIVGGAFSYSGQRCTAVKRVLVMESVADKLSEKLAEKIKKLKVGLPFEEGVTITPLIDNKAADFVEKLINDAIQKGAKILTENKRVKNLIYPILFDKVTLDMDISWEEPFGPVLPIIRVKNIDEAIEISNKSEYGLQGAIFTKDIDKAFYIAQKLEVGTVQINNKTQRGPDHFPFLGVKSSGLGTQGIKYSIEAMTRPKAIVLNIHS